MIQFQLSIAYCPLRCKLHTVTGRCAGCQLKCSQLMGGCRGPLLETETTCCLQTARQLSQQQPSYELPVVVWWMQLFTLLHHHHLHTPDYHAESSSGTNCTHPICIYSCTTGLYHKQTASQPLQTSPALPWSLHCQPSCSAGCTVAAQLAVLW